MSSLYIDDGYTATATIEPAKGLHGELVVQYRPALTKERHTYRIKGETRDASVIENHECELVAKYIVNVNGEPLDKKRIHALKPLVRLHLVNLILGYEPEDEARDAKN